MITNKKYIVAFIIIFLIYAIPEFFFENAMLYLSGGILGGTISEIIGRQSGTPHYVFVFAIWAILLSGVILFFIWLQYKPLKYLVLIVIAFLLYLIDNLFSILPIFETKSIQSALAIKYGVMCLLVLFKSIILTRLYCKGFKK
jgi:hypothetical protein